MTVHYDFAVAHYAADGQRAWLHTLDGPGHFQDFVNDVASDPHGNVVAVGAHGDMYVSGTTTTAASLTDILTLKYGGHGQYRWGQTHSSAGAANDYDGGLVAKSGGIYAAGRQQAATGNDAILLKYRP